MRQDERTTRTVTESHVTLARCIDDASRSTSTINFASVDWPAITRAACGGWMGGILLEAITRHGWSVPSSCLGPLRWQSLQIRESNTQLMSALARICHAFRERGVEVLLLKGAGLNLTLYKRLELRPMSDLDLFVRPSAVARAAAALRSLGFDRGAGLVQEDFFPKFHYEAEFLTDERNPIRVDLHARPFRPMRYAQTVFPDAFWDRALQVNAGDASALIPCDDDQFIHLATHSACHGHERLIWLYDIRRFVAARGDRLDWGWITKRCDVLGLTLPVRQALVRLEELWGPIAPERFTRALSENRTGWRDRLCLRQTPRDSQHPVAHVAVNLLCTKGVWFRLSYLIAIVFPGAEHMGQKYRRRHPGWLLCAHLRRWIKAGIRGTGLGRLARLAVAG